MKNQKSQKNLRILVECAFMIALSVVLSVYTKIYEAPLGGSVTLFSMVPIIIIGLRHGVLWGYSCAFVYSSSYWLFYGIGQISGISAYVFVMSSLIDYILAYTLIGTAGFFKIFIDKSETKRKKIIFALTATLIVCILRFIAHVVVGATVWYEITKANNWNEYVNTVGAWTYSTVYNLQYMIPETIITLVAAPAVVTILSVINKQREK